MWQELAQALCLMLVLEGAMPFLYPHRWRKLIALVATMPDRHVRLLGLLSMASGVGILFLIK